MRVESKAAALFVQFFRAPNSLNISDVKAAPFAIVRNSPGKPADWNQTRQLRSARRKRNNGNRILCPVRYVEPLAFAIEGQGIRRCPEQVRRALLHPDRFDHFLRT